MINLTTLQRQHETIMQEINTIEHELKKGVTSMNVMETALHISKLAGHLRIHLLEEDKFLYPNLINCNDQEIRQLANEYSQEMGDLSSKYIEFKNNYNVGTKISKRQNDFIQEAKVMIEALKKRMNKEDKELYYIIHEKKI
jgi:hypothetical protein